jgi:hypothetical protein
MVDKFGVDVKKNRNNHAETQLSAPILITCLIEEGDIVVADAETAQYRSRMNSEDIYTFTTPATIGDKVQIAAASNYYTYAALKGMPIVQKKISTNNTPIIGEIVGYPMPLLNKPASSGVANSVQLRAASLFYRTVLVKVFAMGYESLAVLGSTVGAVSPGNYILWDNSAAGYQQTGTAGTVASNALACHYSAADTPYVGVLILGPIDVQA